MAAAGAAVRTRPTVGSAAANAVAVAAADVATEAAGPTEVVVGVVASNVSRHRTEEQEEGETTHVVRLEGHKLRMVRYRGPE